ncbi:hypothetical protein RK780_06325, partial [Streptococcus pneumoniae]|nr:hypothetical protein [Streptococcus pneumoniae]MDS5483286.1 hypothetical protein [Streptococcus pneumoniae]MDS5507358.1 hypothetical protein [Streptococcus pneumoniae]MDS8246412.1 hypothetical protein [Streptococcus pneumoniae]
GLTTTLKNAWTTSRQVNFFWVANFNLKFGFCLVAEKSKRKSLILGVITCKKIGDMLYLKS